MAYANGYIYRRTVTIDYTKVNTENQTNFPVLISGTYSYLAHTTHSGLVTDLNGYDIIFTSDAAGSTVLDFEIESYAHDTGEITFWVEVPTVSYTENTVIYMFYGNSSVSTSQENVAGTWNSNFKAIYHLNSGKLGGAEDDSTGVGDLAKKGAGHPADTASGKISGAEDFDGVQTTGDYMTTDDNANNRIVGDLTLEAWVYVHDFINNNAVVGKFGGLAPTRAYLFWVMSDQTIQFEVNDGANYDDLVSTTTLDANTWYYVACTYKVSTKLQSIYINAATPVTRTAASASINNLNTTLKVGARSDLYLNDFFDGIIDEVRISNLCRTAGYVTTSYNNQNSPSTFYEVGDQTEAGSASASVSASPSVSASISISLSPSVSVSVSPSLSPSVSISLSKSPSPSLGFTEYSRGNYASLPSGITDLETLYSGQDVTDVSTKNDVRVAQTAVQEYMIHQFKDFIGNYVDCQLEWEGQSTLAPTSSTVYLQIYNRNLSLWETIDSDDSSNADTDFSLTANINDLIDYKDNSNVITCRIYQLAL